MIDSARLRREALERQLADAKPNRTMTCPDCGASIDERRTAEDLDALKANGGSLRARDGEARPGSPGWHECPRAGRAAMAQTQYDWLTHGR